MNLSLLEKRYLSQVQIDVGSTDHQHVHRQDIIYFAAHT